VELQWIFHSSMQRWKDVEKKRRVGDNIQEPFTGFKTISKYRLSRYEDYFPN